MRRSLLTLPLSVVALLGVVLSGPPASAIINGTLDGNRHPAVGALVSDKVFPDGLWLYCTGTLISPTVFLTAAHCTDQDRVRVTFESEYQSGDRVYAGTLHTDPLYPGNESDSHDIAVVVLEHRVHGTTPARG
jgi:Trypsin